MNIFLPDSIVEVNPRKLGGKPVLRGTRFSISQLLAEIGDHDVIKEIADDFELDEIQLRQVIHALALSLDQYTGKAEPIEPPYDIVKKQIQAMLDLDKIEADKIVAIIDHEIDSSK